MNAKTKRRMTKRRRRALFSCCCGFSTSLIVLAFHIQRLPATISTRTKFCAKWSIAFFILTLWEWHSKMRLLNKWSTRLLWTPWPRNSASLSIAPTSKRPKWIIKVATGSQHLCLSCRFCSMKINSALIVMDNTTLFAFKRWCVSKPH